VKGQLTEMRGVYLVAAELSRLGFIASPTSRSALAADILVPDQAVHAPLPGRCFVAAVEVLSSRLTLFFDRRRLHGTHWTCLWPLSLSRRRLTMPTLSEVLDAARTLTPTERMRLVDALWEDVPPAEWPLPSEQWIAEAQRRSADYDPGRMSASTWAEVGTRARRKAGLDG
jgi:putative addiction module component (TIGR02574 family)